MSCTLTDNEGERDLPGRTGWHLAGVVSNDILAGCRNERGPSRTSIVARAPHSFRRAKAGANDFRVRFILFRARN
jgi:hypothetical protein